LGEARGESVRWRPRTWWMKGLVGSNERAEGPQAEVAVQRQERRAARDGEAFIADSRSRSSCKTLAWMQPNGANAGAPALPLAMRALLSLHAITRPSSA
jgi:hypothetical protein